VLPVLLGLTSAATWGSADFLGGLLSRRAPVLRVMLLSQGVAALVLLVALLAARPEALSTGQMLAAAGAGAAGTVALGAFYRALALGTMSIVAPISATGAAIPVAVGLASGDRPSALQGAGVALAVVGVVLAAREEGEPVAGHATDRRAHRTAIVLALASAIGFGIFFVGMDTAADGGVVWALTVARWAAVAWVLVAVLVTRTSARPGPGEWPSLLGMAALDLVGQSTYALATTKGLLSLVAVLGALYPVTTVLLARVILKERVRRLQEAGVAGALLGVALIAGG
jgi:drug/metabolite transporter (DMT)-like permease